MDAHRGRSTTTAWAANLDHLCVSEPQCQSSNHSGRFGDSDAFTAIASRSSLQQMYIANKVLKRNQRGVTKKAKPCFTLTSFAHNDHLMNADMYVPNVFSNRRMCPSTCLIYSDVGWGCHGMLRDRKKPQCLLLHTSRM